MRSKFTQCSTFSPDRNIYITVFCCSFKGFHYFVRVGNDVFFNFIKGCNRLKACFADFKPVSEFFAYGLAVITIPGWAAGTVLGIIFGDILPPSVVSALSVALYAMFTAVIIPPARKDRRLALLVVVSMLASLVFTFDPLSRFISEGMKIIILTLVLSAAAALIWPVEEET